MLNTSVLKDVLYGNVVNKSPWINTGQSLLLQGMIHKGSSTTAEGTITNTELSK